jgi:PIN domain nuclease of toxin-antitoxin system
MEYLIDTHTLLWIVANNPKLSKKAKNIYLNRNNKIYVSIATIWELSIKIGLNKLNINIPLNKFVDIHIVGNNIKILNINLNHLYRIEKLPLHHRDPFDRLIISQAIEDKIPIIGSDELFDYYQIKRIW